MRKANRLLSRVRDAAAVLKALDALRKQFPGTIDAPAFGRVRQLLGRDKRRRERMAGADRSWSKVVKASRELQKIARHWKLKHREFAALAPGIRDEYRRGRELMRVTRKRARAADFHEWRKRLKGLWYDLRLVEEYDPAAQRLALLLHATQNWLGDDHNLVVLCARLKKAATLEDQTRVRQAVNRYRRVLRAKALKAGTRAYAGTSRATVTLAARAWRASQ